MVGGSLGRMAGPLLLEGVMMGRGLVDPLTQVRSTVSNTAISTSSVQVGTHCSWARQWCVVVHSMAVANDGHGPSIQVNISMARRKVWPLRILVIDATSWHDGYYLGTGLSRMDSILRIP